MRYLCDAYGAPDHWFPTDLRERALVNKYLDSHHGDLRKGLSGTIVRKVLMPANGKTVPEKEVKEFETHLENVLKKLDKSLET